MKFFKNLIELFYPRICLACKEFLVDNESLICVGCRHDLPLTHFCDETENLLERVFFGRIRLEQATALFYFSKKGRIQELIHALKYRNHQKLGLFFGAWLGENIKESTRFQNLTCIVPVPLDKIKQKKRGYNQLTEFGKGLAAILGIPFVENMLIRSTISNSQTKKLRKERWENVHELFSVLQPEIFENEHVLLIDDIVTTGATIEACSLALKKGSNLKISLACIAFTK